MLNLGLEHLNVNDEKIITEDDMIQMHLDQSDIRQDLDELKSTIDATKNMLSIMKSLHNYGGYQGFENLVTECDQLSNLIGVNICKASSNQFNDLYSNEILRDTLNKFFTKINSLFGRLGDRISNFIKTTLPFKEKYYGEMKALKAELSGRKINEERFQECKVASALSKERFNEYIKKQNDVFKGVTQCCDICTGPELEKFLNAADNAPDSIRTTFGLFVNVLSKLFYPAAPLGMIFMRGGTFVKPPILSWFTSDRISNLGWKGSDVVDIIDTSIKEIESLIETNSKCGRIVVQIQAASKKIELLRAENKVQEAIEMREQIARVEEFFFQIYEACSVYETMVRRTMYFATYIGRAARKCLE